MDMTPTQALQTLEQVRLCANMSGRAHDEAKHAINVLAVELQSQVLEKAVAAKNCETPEKALEAPEEECKETPAE